MQQPYSGVSMLGRHVRTWPALLCLFFLAPATGEMLSGSTPPLMFIQPFSLILETGLYGGGAILVRELVRRRGLGWLNLLILGAAYGVLEEALVVTSWFNPNWADLGYFATYGRLWDTNWPWAVGLTIYHAVVSITLPIVLTETIFPRLAAQPWLGRKGFRLCAGWLGFISVFGLVFFGFVAYHAKGYSHPPLMYIWAVVLAIGLVWTGLHLRQPRHALSLRPLPGLWRLRLIGFGGTFAFFFLLWVAPHLIPFAPTMIALMVVFAVFMARRIAQWARRVGWGAAQRLALLIGVMSFFLLLAPVVEFVSGSGNRVTAGMTFAAFFWLAGMIWLSFRVGRKMV